MVGRGVALCARVAKYLGSPSQGTAQGGIVPTDHRAIHQGAGELGRFVEVVLPVAGWLVFSSCRREQGRGAVRVSLRFPPTKPQLNNLQNPNPGIREGEERSRKLDHCITYHCWGNLHHSNQRHEETV